MNYIGRMLILSGLILIVAGVFFGLGGKIPWLGRLPGDIIIHKKNFTFYFPLATSLLASVILSAVIFLFFKR